MNQHYFNVVRMIWESQDSWQYDDNIKGATNPAGYIGDLPIAKKNISANAYEYVLPTDAQRVRTVYYNNTLLSPKDPDSMTFQSTGTPLYYSILGRSILLEPTPTSALSAGLKVHLDRTPSGFGSASTASPSFPEPFHRILSYGASIDFTQDNQQRALFVRQKEQLEASLKNFYSHRNAEQQNIISPRSKKLWRRYT